MAFLLTLRRRSAMLVAAFLAADAAIAMAACSTSSPAESSGVDATVGPGPGTEGGKDGPVGQPDSSSDGGGGNCSPSNDKCDIVRQNCPAMQECVVGPGNKTVCTPVDSSQQLPKGRGCCPSTTANPCLPGLTCVGNPCVDGGPATTGRCSPACCKGDDQACGKSDPEGISGACDITLVDTASSTPLYEVCTYRQTCKPFKIEPCTAGQTCLVEDKVGTASCVDSFGKTNRQPCTFGNECADGLICLGGGDAGVCHYVCLLPGATHPFDAGVEEGGAGKGGCPVSEKCNITITNTPSWFAACSLDGG